MAPVSNRFAKYIIQPDTAGGGSAPAPKANRFAKYKAGEAPAVQQANPMVAQGQAAQQAWRDGGAKPANPNPENPIITAQRGSQTASMSQWSQQREAERQAEAARVKSRRESAAAFGGGMDMLPTEDAGGNVRPGTAVDADLSKGIVGAPLQALEAVKDAGVSMANLAGETYNAANKAITAPLGVKPWQAPKITTPDNPLIGEGGALQSISGDLERNLMQFLISRKIVGNVAPGGGTAAQLGKDALALGAGFDADTGRLSETVNEFVQQSGSPQVAKDYIGWLAERDPNNPLLERFKNMVEDLTISGPLVAPQAAVRGGQAIGNALAPVARTPTNAGGTAARAAVADPYLVREASPTPAPGAAGAAPAAPQKSMFSSTGQYSVSTQDSGAFDVNLNRMNDGGVVIFHDKGTIEYKPEFAKGKSDEELLAYTFEPLGFEGATKAASAVQPPITAFPVTSPRPPTTRSQAAGAGAPPPPAQPPAVVAQPGAGAPPPGTLTPVPTANAATAEFNALPRKVRESVFRAMRNSGFDNNGVIAAIRDLNTLPPDRQSMFATELVRKYGAQFPELEANLAAMGRKFAVDTPKPRQIFGRTIERDGARQLMNDEVRSQIDSEADYLNGTVERLFGPGAVPAKEELLRLQQAGGAEYRRLLSTTNRYGRARAPAKRAEIDRNVATLANYLKRPEVMNNVPDWVKQKVMLEVSNDLRQLKFTPDEQALIVAGDPGLAALFTPDAPLAYSPQLWKTLVDLYPTQSAHSLQSAYAKAIREARFSPDPQTRVWVDTLSRARGKSTVRANARNTDDRGFGLLKMLEDAVPGYKEARMKYGNVMGAQEALDDARQFMSIAGDETKLAQFVDDFEDLSDLQRTAVENQVSSIIRQSIANKVDNPKLAELGREGPSTPNLTAISKQPFLDALPQVFGPKGQEMADAIRMARSNTDYLTGLHPKYNSRTGVNEADVKNADRIYEDPAGAESTVLDNAVTQGLGGAGLGAAFIPGAAGAAIPLIGLAAAKALWTARKAGKRLSPSEKTQLAEFLFRSRRQGGNAAEGGTPPGGPPQLPGPRGPSPLDTGGNMAAGAAIGAAVGGAASNGDPNAMLAGAAVGATGGALRARARNSSSLIPVSKPKNALAVAGGSTPSPTNALATPSRPPVKAGFGGSSQTNMPPELGGAIAGGAAGYAAAPEDQKGAGAVLGGLGGAGVGRLARGGLPNSGMKHALRRELGGSSKPLDMSEAGRMQRAREQGFDVETPLYHGTDAKFDEFARNPTHRNDNGYYGKGTYFSTSPDEAAYFAEWAPGANAPSPTAQVVKAYARGKLFEVNDGGNVTQIVPRFLNSLKGMKGLPKQIEELSQQWEDAVAKVNVEPITVQMDNQSRRMNYNIPDEMIDAEGVATVWKDADTAAARYYPSKEDAVASLAYRQLERDGIRFPMGVDAAIQRNIGADAFSELLKRNGYDGVRAGDEVVIFDPKNIRRTDAAFDPSQSGSSTLLAGMGAAPEGIGAAGGATAGYALNPTDANGDGVIDDADRGLNAMGGLISGGLGVKGARMGVGAAKAGANAPRNIGKAPELPPLTLPKMQRAREEWGKGYQVFEGTHATSADFDAFDPTKIGQSDPGWYGRGHYFARADKGFKEQYSRPNSKGFAYGQVDQASSPLDRSLKEGSRNIPVLIRMKKPFTDDAAANPKVAQAFWDAGYRSIERDARNGKPRRVLPPGSDERRPLLAQDAETFSNVAKSLGYDGANWGGEIVVFPGNEANIRGKFAKFDPSQSGSSKLLAGMGASPEGLGAAAGGAAGYFANPTDANGDGVIDDADRGLNAMGGLISGGLGVKAARSGANAVRNAMIPQARVMAEAAAPVGSTTIPKPTQAGFLPSGSGKPGAKPPANALAGPISPRVLEDAGRAAKRLPTEVRNKLSANALSENPAPAMQASGFSPDLFSFAQDARTPAPGPVENAFNRLTRQPSANALEMGLRKSIESVAGQRGRSALRVGDESVPDLPFGMRMAMGERNATRKEQSLARRAYTSAEKKNKLDTPKVQRVVAAEREARMAQDILDQARLDAFSTEDVGAIVREQMDAIAKAMNRAPPSTLGLPTKGQQVSDALDNVVFGAPPKGLRSRPKANDATYSISEANDAAKLLFSREYANIWDDIVSGRTPVESIKPGSKQHLVLTVAAVGGLGALGISSAVLADRSGPMKEPEYPKPEDPRVYFKWDEQRRDPRFIENLQLRLNQIDPRYQLREDGQWVEGGNTDKVIKFWQDQNGFTPDGNLTEEQAAMIEAQAIDALRSEPAGARSGLPKRQGSTAQRPAL